MAVKRIKGLNIKQRAKKKPTTIQGYMGANINTCSRLNSTWRYTETRKGAFKLELGKCQEMLRDEQSPSIRICTN